MTGDSSSSTGWRQLELDSSTARQAHGDVAAQHCAVQLPQCSMVALSILECMGVGGGRALRGALASGGFTLKIFLYNKLPT